VADYRPDVFDLTGHGEPVRLAVLAEGT